MGSYYWIKLYHEILDDPKMGRLPDRLWRRAVELFLLAGETGSDGRLPDINDMVWKLRIPANELEADLKALMEKDIVTSNDGHWVVINFAKRQAATSGAERTARCRDRKRQVQQTSNSSETERERNGNESVTKRYTDIESESELESEPESDIPPTAETPAQKPPQRDPLTSGQRGFLDLFGAKRFKTIAQREAVLKMEQEHGATKLLEVARWAAEKGMGVGQAVGSVRTALPKWGTAKRKVPNQSDPHAGVVGWLEAQGIEAQ